MNTFKSIYSQTKRPLGQSLIEIIVGISIAVIFIVSATFVISAFLSSTKSNRNFQTAVSLGKQLMDNLKVVSDSSWGNIYTLTPSSNYYLITTSSPFATSTGTEGVTQDGAVYTRYFYTERVLRDNNGAGDIVSGSCGDCAEDPSTLHIVVRIIWPGSADGYSISEYFFRGMNTVFRQDKWSGGVSGGSVPATSTINVFGESENIDFGTSSGAIQLQNP